MNASLMFVFSSNFSFETGLFCNNPFSWAKLLDRSTLRNNIALLLLPYQTSLSNLCTKVGRRKWARWSFASLFSPSFLWSLTLTHKLLAFHACLCLQPNCKKQRGGRCNWLVVASHHHLREVGRGCKSRVMGGGGGVFDLSETHYCCQDQIHT